MLTVSGISYANGVAMLMAALATLAWTGETSERVTDKLRAVELVPPSPHAGSHVYRRAPDGMFYVTGQINGQSIRFLVDTGASTTMLTDVDAQRVGLTLGAKPQNRTITTVSDAMTAREQILPAIKVAGTNLARLPVVVVPNRLGFSLLGQDALRRLGTITFAGDTMVLAVNLESGQPG